ncbi:MAG: hypothetical protein ACRC4M_01485 [Mycoplasma sp.]
MKINLVNNRIKAILILINSYFWKTKIGPLFSVCFPLIMMSIYWVLSQAYGSLEEFVYGIPSYICLTVMPLSLLTLSSLKIEFKRSIIFRKIKASGVGVLKLHTILYIYYIIMNWFFLLITFTFFFLFCREGIRDFDWINWGGIIYETFVLMLVSIAIANLLGVIFKTPINAQLLGFGCIMLTMILGGSVIHITQFAKVKELGYISLAWPPSGILHSLNIAALRNNSNDIFAFDVDFILLERVPLKILDGWFKIYFLIAPLVTFIVCESSSIVNFKWSSR